MSEGDDDVMCLGAPLGSFGGRSEGSDPVVLTLDQYCWMVSSTEPDLVFKCLRKWPPRGATQPIEGGRFLLSHECYEVVGAAMWCLGCQPSLLVQVVNEEAD